MSGKLRRRRSSFLLAFWLLADACLGFTEQLSQSSNNALLHPQVLVFSVHARYYLNLINTSNPISYPLAEPRNDEATAVTWDLLLAFYCAIKLLVCVPLLWVAGRHAESSLRALKASACTNEVTEFTYDLLQREP